MVQHLLPTRFQTPRPSPRTAAPAPYPPQPAGPRAATLRNWVGGPPLLPLALRLLRPRLYGTRLAPLRQQQQMSLLRADSRDIGAC